MKSSDAVFTRQNPFPPESLLARTHYYPSEAMKISKQQKRLALSPVRLHRLASSPERTPQTASLSLEDQRFLERSHRVPLPAPSVQEHQNFSESWPSNDHASCGASSCTEPQGSQQQPIISSAQEPSVLAKYIERFRYGRPQSREEREKLPAGGVDEQPFWWRSSSPLHPSSSTPTQTSKERFRGTFNCRNDGMDGMRTSAEVQAHTLFSPTRDLHDLSMLALSDSSYCEPGESEILQLQEKASRLLQKSENSLSSGSNGVPISSEGLGCSDFSSPVSVDEPVRRPLVSSLIDSKLLTTPSSSGGCLLPAPSALGTKVSRPCPENDILFQWRLRRKMEQAREWSQASSPSSAFHQSSWSRLAQQSNPVSADPHQRAGFFSKPSPMERTDSIEISAARTELQAANPASSESICKLQPETRIQTHADCITCRHFAPFRQPLKEKATLEPRAPCTNPQSHLTVQDSSSESSVLPSSTHQTASSPSAQPSESAKRKLHSYQSKKDTQAKDRPGRETGGKKAISSVRVKKTDRHTGCGVARNQQVAKVNDRHARSQNGVCCKTKESNIEKRSQRGAPCSTGDIRSRDCAPPPSPIQNTLGQVVSEVLFPGADSPTQPKKNFSSDSGHTPTTPPQSPPPPAQIMPQPSAVIDQLMQEAEESDGLEFEDDPLLLVLRQQRKWVKEQLCEVDMMLSKPQED